MAKEIRSESAPAPIGPYSQAIEVNGAVFCSGQIALDPKTGAMVGTTPGAQTERIFDNIEAVLAAAGITPKSIVKTTIFLTDMASFGEVNSVYERRLGGHRPARSTVAVTALPKNALVEIECIAVR